MSDKGPKKRKSKGWYRKQAHLNKRQKMDETHGHRLTPGLKGFIVTCNDREKDAVKESYNILNEYAEKLYGPEKKAGTEEAGGSEDEEDIEKALSRQVQELKDAGTTGARRFQNSQTGAKNCIFIKTTLDDPVALAYAIFTDLLQTKVQKCRYALRLLPVVGTCKANVKEINELAKLVLGPFFSETKLEVTYTISFKARNNNGLGREMTISTLRETIKETFPSVLLRYTPVNPQITILLEVMCGVACIAVAKDFAHFRKYNLVEVVQEKQRQDSDVENKKQRQDSDSKNEKQTQDVEGESEKQRHHSEIESEQQRQDSEGENKKQKQGSDGENENTRGASAAADPGEVADAPKESNISANLVSETERNEDCGNGESCSNTSGKEMEEIASEKCTEPADDQSKPFSESKSQAENVNLSGDLSPQKSVMSEQNSDACS